MHKKNPCGTGHALTCALSELNQSSQVLVLCADVPLIQANTLKKLCRQTRCLGLITAKLEAGGPYGRIIRNAQGHIEKIIEAADANNTQLGITEINCGIYCFDSDFLHQVLPSLDPHNQQQEFYLTDLIEKAASQKKPITSLNVVNLLETTGVNTQTELCQLERYYQYQQAQQLLQAGVRLADPKRLDIRGELQIGKNCYIDVNVIFEGQVSIEDNCHIEANCIIRNSHIKQGCKIQAFSHIDTSEIAEQAQIGPYARLRPNSKIGPQARIGNFVEIKNATIGEQSKAAHLSYIGDAVLGKNVNIGAGSITCNYDGANKHKTIIADQAFIGANSQLIAPINIGKQATIAAGSSITHDVAEQQLAIARTQQKNIDHWQRPIKNKEN